MFKSIKLTLITILFLLFLSSIANAEQHKVIRVVDGDTIVIDYNGEKEKIRMLRVNTPESVHKDPSKNVPMGKVASKYTKKRLSGKSVSLEFEDKKRGVYGRLLAYVFVDGQNYCLELVKKGYSPYYTKYGRSQKYDKEFREAENYAKEKKRNIWSD